MERLSRRLASRGTLKTHIGNLLTKLAARDRAQLVIAGYEAGLADPTGYAMLVPQ